MKRQAMLAGALPLMAMGELTRSTNARAPQADVSNANYLMGDIEDYGDAVYGDIEDGDAEDYGDAVYGDVSDTAQNSFDLLMGDAEIGALSRRAKRGLALAGGVAGGAVLGKVIANAVKKRQAQKQAVQRSMAAKRSRNPLTSQLEARQMMGKIPLTTAMRFFTVSGGTLNSSPIRATESFPAEMMKLAFSRQQTDTPFEVDIVNGTFAGVTWTATALGAATNRFYVAAILRVGMNQFNGNPGTIFNVTGIIPTINGNLTISTPFSLLMTPGFYTKLTIYPWLIVTQAPIFTMGQYSNANPVTLSITGLPSTANVTLTIPGTQYSWTIGMRNRLA